MAKGRNTLSDLESGGSEKGVVRLEVGETKNEHARDYFLDSQLKALFQKRWDTRKLGCRYVLHRDGKKIRDFRGAWDKACVDAGIGERFLHDFRRTAVRDMVRAGIPERGAMTVSGQKTGSVFDGDKEDAILHNERS